MNKSTTLKQLFQENQKQRPDGTTPLLDNQVAVLKLKTTPQQRWGAQQCYDEYNSINEGNAGGGACLIFEFFFKLATPDFHSYVLELGFWEYNDRAPRE